MSQFWLLVRPFPYSFLDRAGIDINLIKQKVGSKRFGITQKAHYNFTIMKNRLKILHVINFNFDNFIKDEKYILTYYLF